MIRPPDEAVEAALAAARKSPCAKSQRGVSAYLLLDAAPAPITVVATGFNGPPGTIPCDGSDACRASCKQRCVHAEMRALRQVATMPLRHRVSLVHVELDGAGALVAGGGPSCWQCSREVLDVGVAGVWLYQYGVIGPRGLVGSAWLFYEALDFHQMTLVVCQIGGPR